VDYFFASKDTGGQGKKECSPLSTPPHPNAEFMVHQGMFLYEQ